MPTIPPDKDEVIVLIDGKEFGGWTEFEDTHHIDSFSTVTFGAPFEADRRAFRDAFRPYSFAPLEVGIDGESIFKGTLVGPSPNSDPTASSVYASAYSLPGVLATACVPAENLPLEFRGLTLHAMALALCRPLGIEVQLDVSDGSPFAKSKLEVDQFILDFLAEAARQRGVVLSNTTDGALLIQRSTGEGRPVARLEGGISPVVGVIASPPSEEYYSHITGFSTTKKGKLGSHYTVRNPKLPASVVRPSNFTLSDTESGDVPAAATAKLARMFGASCAYDVDLCTWRDPRGKLYIPNTTTTLKAPNAMVYSDYEFLIRTVTRRRDAVSKTASLRLVLPGAYSGQIPKAMPWDEPGLLS